jgi:hypothetical protein
MTSQYSGNNMQLQYDPETQQWSYVNVAQTFIDTATFSSTDPQFQYGSDNQQDDDQEDDADADPCPPGYRLVTLSDGSVTCEIIEPVQQDRGGDDERPEPPRPDPLQQSFRENKEAMESFFELKNEGKIDFNTYDPKTNLVEYNRNPNETTLGQLAKAFIPGVAGIEFIDNAMDEAELKKAGMLITDENGKQFINLKTGYEVLVTKVMNPGVPEGNVLANTPGYYGLEDSNNFYKNIFNDMTVKKEDMKILGSTDVGILSDELIKAEDKFKNSKSNFGDFSVMGNTYFYKGKRLNQGEINKLIQSGINNAEDILNEIKKDESKYIVTKQETKADSDSADPSILDDIDDAMEDSGSSSGPGTPGYVAPGTGATGAPGRDYGSDAEANRRRRQQNNQQFTKASQEAAAARQKTIAQRAKISPKSAMPLGASNQYKRGTGGGAPGYN